MLIDNYLSHGTVMVFWLVKMEYALGYITSTSTYLSMCGLLTGQVRQRKVYLPLTWLRRVLSTRRYVHFIGYFIFFFNWPDMISLTCLLKGMCLCWYVTHCAIVSQFLLRVPDKPTLLYTERARPCLVLMIDLTSFQIFRWS